MSIASLSPVIGRIQQIEARFAMPGNARLMVGGASSSNDTFAAALSAAMGTTPAAGATSTAAAGRTQPFVDTVVPSGLSPTPPPATASAYDSLFEQAGARYGVPAQLLSAVGWVESRYQPDAVSGAGAIGLMQIMPFVAVELGVDPTDPAQAIDGAARLLRSHYDRFGSWDLALAAYNAGAGAVSNAGNTIPSPGVAEYVRRVNERMNQS